mmetsp:Transcript_27346/g.62787  ORF Transcript_27346/g.62787 Transcript_27346/m.62787 type:complete len:87 (-) Transcript_27346:421-681(-)
MYLFAPPKQHNSDSFFLGLGRSLFLMEASDKILRNRSLRQQRHVKDSVCPSKNNLKTNIEELTSETVALFKIEAASMLITLRGILQ